MKKERIKNLMRYDNRINNMSINSINTLEQNILFAIICGMYGKTEFIFDIEQLRRLASGGLKPISKDRIETLLKGMFQGIFHGYITERIGNETVNVHLFRAINLVHNDNNELVGLKVLVDELARDIFIRKQGNLTITDYDIFASIRSTYVKSIFRLLSQFKSTGFARFKYDEFLRIVSCPDSYRQEDIKARILEPAKKIIGDYFKDLDYRLVKEYRLGRKVITGIEFRFKKIVYKSEVSEIFKSLELKGKDYQELKILNNGLHAVNSLNSSAEQTIISSQLERKKRNILNRKGFYGKLDELNNSKYECKNDLSKKLEYEG